MFSVRERPIEQCVCRNNILAIIHYSTECLISFLDDVYGRLKPVRKQVRKHAFAWESIAFACLNAPYTLIFSESFPIINYYCNHTEEREMIKFNFLLQHELG